MAYLLVTLGAALWGLIGIFVHGLYEIGFTPLQVVVSRVFSAMLMLLLYVYIKNKELLKINIRDSFYFVGTGILSLALFFWCFFSAIQETSYAIAAILLYTAPAFVTIISRMVFKEKLTFSKVIALSITFIGILFIIGIFPNVDLTITLYGFILGIGSGFGYALYSIFAKAALEKYDSLTVITYTFIFTSLSLLPFSGLWEIGYVFTETKTWLYTLGIGFFPTVLAYLLYTNGLKHMESSRASITATVEPIVATLLGVIVFQEVLSAWQILGIVLVIGAVILVQERSPKKINVNQVANKPRSELNEEATYGIKEHNKT